MHQIKNVCEGTYELSKGKGKVEVEDDSMNQEDLDDIDEYLAFPLKEILQAKIQKEPKCVQVHSTF